MNRFTCRWAFDSLVILCDGTVVCGCADPYGERPLGSVFQTPVMEIWNSPKLQEIRHGLNNGYSSFCIPCGLKKTLKNDDIIEQRPVRMDYLPRIFLEPTVLCNLACFESVCSKTSHIKRTRRQPYFPFDRFRELIDQTAGQLIRVDLFNYGEPFLHSDIIRMIQYIKDKNPDIFVYISTNGLAISHDQIRGIVQSRLDEITFSVDGARQKIYEKYRIGGRLDKVVETISRLVEEREMMDVDHPWVNFRCILFKWNDSWLERRRIIHLAEKLDVDRLTWEITDHPESAKSRRFQIGTRHWRRLYHQIWDTSQHANALKQKQYQAHIRVDNKNIENGPGETRKQIVTVTNTGGALWLNTTRNGRRTVRLGAQLYDSCRNLIDRDYARAFIPCPMRRNDQNRLEITLPAIQNPGEYWLKFDMVCEGIEWFESVGSPVVWCSYRFKSNNWNK